MIAWHLRNGAGAKSIDHRKSDESTVHSLCARNRLCYKYHSRKMRKKIRQHRSRFGEILNGDPAASPLGGAYKLGAPYSSHHAPQRVRRRSFSTCGLAWAKTRPWAKRLSRQTQGGWVKYRPGVGK